MRTDRIIVQPLLLIANADDYIRQGKNVLEDGVSNAPLLHQVLSWTRSDTAVEKLPIRKGEIVKARAKAIKKIVDTHPDLLSQHDAHGFPPFQRALQFQSMFTIDDITKTLRAAIFHRLKKDPDAVRHALYGRSGMSTLSCSVPAC